jgi:hypothetical protein
VVGVSGDGLRSVGEAYLPLTKSGCSILPVARHLRAGVQLPGPRFLKATAVLALSGRGRAVFTDLTIKVFSEVCKGGCLVTAVSWYTDSNQHTNAGRPSPLQKTRRPALVVDTLQYLYS